MKFNIDKDLKWIREFFDMTQEKMANTLGVERISIIRIEEGVSYPRNEFLKSFYDFCFSNALQLNVQKEYFYKDDIEDGHILLTHASKSEITGDINLESSRRNNDFGKGFYCGDSYEKAVAFVSTFDNPSVYFLDFDPRGLKKYQFQVDREWMLIIAFFRGRLDKYKNHPLIKDALNKISTCDYIIAPIADNRMFRIIDSFIEGEITDEQCVHSLAATNLGVQYVMLTNKAISKIKILERCFVSPKEKEKYAKEQLENMKIGEDKTKLARIQYRGKGKYIEEILHEEN